MDLQLEYLLNLLLSCQRGYVIFLFCLTKKIEFDNTSESNEDSEDEKEEQEEVGEPLDGSSSESIFDSDIDDSEEEISEELVEQDEQKVIDTVAHPNRLGGTDRP